MCGAGLCSLVPAWQPFAAVWGVPAHPTWLWDVITFRTRGAAGEGGCWKAEGQTAPRLSMEGCQVLAQCGRGAGGTLCSVCWQRCSPIPRDGPTLHTPAALGRVSLTCCRVSIQPNTPCLGFLSPSDCLHCCMCQHPAWGTDAALLPALSSALQSAEALIIGC